MRNIRATLAATVAALAVSMTVTAAEPFWTAVARGDVRAVKTLLVACSETNMPTASDAKKLADWIGACQAVGVDIRAKEGGTPLHLASSHGHLKVVTALLEAGSDVNVRDNDGDTPLHSSVWMGRLDIVNALLKAGADVNAQDDHGITPLYYGLQENHVEVVAALVKAGADVNVRDFGGRTLLHRSVWMGRLDIVSARQKTLFGRKRW